MYQSMEEFLSNGTDSGEKNVIQQKTVPKGNVFIGWQEGVLNCRELTLTRVHVQPMSSYNIFLDGVCVVDGSFTHEPNDKYKNPLESMKPVTKHPNRPNCFCFGVRGFLNFGVPNVFHMVITIPFHQVLNYYLLCSQFIPYVPNVFPIELHFKPIGFAQGSIVTNVGRQPRGEDHNISTLGELTIGSFFFVVGR